ncbi:hypothetical protein B0H10DRAFT_1960246 [Mycena sp. CBHHK59/15]|nr:hypothetical protein B0H10DRAFT_1960246 [Mycena sp. CBHHK59/15]
MPGVLELNELKWPNLTGFGSQSIPPAPLNAEKYEEVVGVKYVSGIDDGMAGNGSDAVVKFEMLGVKYVSRVEGGMEGIDSSGNTYRTSKKLVPTGCPYLVATPWEEEENLRRWALNSELKHSILEASVITAPLPDEKDLHIVLVLTRPLELADVMTSVFSCAANCFRVSFAASISDSMQENTGLQ